jgi:hypothetical protein
MSAHAILSPSAAYRWFACPGSIRLSSGVEGKSSVFAQEGTAAHTLAEMCLTGGMDAVIYIGGSIDVDGTLYDVTEEMADAVQVFLDLVRGFVEDGYEMRAEVKLDLGHLWPGQFGTGDAVLFKPDIGDLHVVDFKYGRGVVVEPDENPQLLSYLSGAARLFHNHKVESVSAHIVQPRTPGAAINSWETTVERLADFEDEFRQAAEIASRGDAPLVPGDWCQFCPAAGFCPALRDQSLKIAQAEFTDGDIVLPDVVKLDARQLGKIMSEVALVEAWCGAVREHALASALDGITPDGFKIVAKMTKRRWVDDDKAAGALRSLYELDDKDLYIRKIISPAAAEKLVGKASAKSLASLTTKPPGGATLAPLSDKRKPLSTDAAGEFGDE